MQLQDLAELHRCIVGIQNLEEANTLFPERQEFDLIGNGLQTGSLYSFPGSLDVVYIYADVIDGTVITLGAIAHICVDVDDIEATLEAVKAAGLKPINDEIEFLPFWEKGVRFFKVLDPNNAPVEFCQIL